MKIPIIFYHAIFDKQPNTDKYSISKVAFRRQIEYLYKNGFKSLSLDDIFKPENSNTGEKIVVISFDDGHESDYTIAFPILKEYGFTATFFVTVGWVGTKNYVTWANLKEMSSNGMLIASHSMTHSFLSDVDSSRLRKELEESKMILEEKLGIPVNFMSLPGGFCSGKVLNMAKGLKYIGVCTSAPGVISKAVSKKEFTALERILITRKTQFKTFEKIVNCDRKQIALNRIQYHFKSNVRRILGSKNYYRIWSIFFKKTFLSL